MNIPRKQLGLLVFYYIGFSALRRLSIRLRGNPVSRFLVFHDVLPEDRTLFRANLIFLKKHANVVSLADFFADRLSRTSINAVITFDDGYKGWVQHALPILDALELPATFFVSSGSIGLSKNEGDSFLQSRFFKRLGPRPTTGTLGFDEIRRLSEGRFTVGGHTLNHCDLSEILQPVNLEREIREDRRRLQELCGTEIEFFAYPSGVYQTSNLDPTHILKAAGYKGALTTNPGFNTSVTHRYFLHRDIVYPSMLPTLFKSIVCGNYDVIRWLRGWFQPTHTPFLRHTKGAFAERPEDD